MKKRVRVGSRGSRLALIQAESVLTGLRNRFPDIQFDLIRIATLGDKLKDVQIDRIPGEGAFVKEVENELLSAHIDIAVHSLKDLPTQITSGITLASITQRLDCRDVLVSTKGKLCDLASGSKIGTGSPRRRIQLLERYPELVVQGIRGNVETRLKKIHDSEYDAVILAAAAMIRLGIEDQVTEYLPVDHFTPQVGQGALAIERRTDDTAVDALVQALNHEETWQCVTAERAFLHVLGGGCSAPITALGRVYGSSLKLEGFVASRDGGTIVRATENSSTVLSEETGKRLAEKMLNMGARTLISQGESSGLR